MPPSIDAENRHAFDILALAQRFDYPE
jgi:hypothetical protein